MKIAVYIKWFKGKPKNVLITDFKDYNKSYNLWGSDKTIFKIKSIESKIFDTINESDKVLIVDYKSFIEYFGIIRSPVVYDVYYEDNHIKRLIEDFNSDLLFKTWQKIRANACEVYHSLQYRGVFLDYKVKTPIYSIDVFSGRSKTKGFSIQGMNSNHDIKHWDRSKDVFLAFDWISADARVCALLSQDELLLECFNDSDPYEYISGCLDGKVDRDICKNQWNKAVNALDLQNPILGVFPKFHKWLKSQVNFLNRNRYTESFLGRRFYSDGSHKQDRRAINAIFQGSVAHAMQSAIVKTFNVTDGLLTEQHDSMTVCCDNRTMSGYTKEIMKIFYKPIDGYDFTFPYRIGIGSSWADYKYFKEKR